jgi:pescadillo protein
LLPTNKYFLGVTLPPHLSPFSNAHREITDYVPPEEKALRDPNLIVQHEISDAENEDGEDGPKQTEGELNLALVNAFREENKQIRAENQVEEKGGKKIIEPESDSDEEIDVADMLEYSDDENAETEEKELTKEQKRELAKEKMVVKSGNVFKVDTKKEKKLTEQELKLRAKMVKPRHKKLYHKLLEKRAKATKETKLLENKRRQIDETRKKVRAKKNNA